MVMFFYRRQSPPITQESRRECLQSGMPEGPNVGPRR